MTTSSVISLPFSFDSNGAVAYTTDSKKIWQDRIVLVVMTLFKERVMRPTFGSGARQASLEHFNTALTMIQTEIHAAFSKWLPELSLLDVNGTLDTSNVLNIVVTYRYGQQNSDTVTLQTALLSSAGDVISEVSNVN